MSRWTTTVTPAALDRLTVLIQQRHPGDEASVAQPRLSLIGEGISTMTYAWPALDGDWVLRVSRTHPEPWTWRGGRAHEVELLAALGQQGIPAPLDGVVIEEVDGLPAAIMERRVRGRPLSRELAAKPSMVSRIAAILDALHAFDVDRLGESANRAIPRDDPTGELRQAWELVDLDQQLHDLVDAAITSLESRRAIRVLCHRDFRQQHLITDDDARLVGLLDFGEIGIDDPAVDLAFLQEEFGPELVARICTEMITADPDLAEAARTFAALWPLLELAPGGEWWGEPATARRRLAAGLR